MSINDVINEPEFSGTRNRLCQRSSPFPTTFEMCLRRRSAELCAAAFPVQIIPIAVAINIKAVSFSGWINGAVQPKSTWCTTLKERQ